MRFLRMDAAMLAAVALVACAELTPASGVAPSSPEQPVSDLAASASPTPSPIPSYRPAPDFTSGVVVRRTAIGVVLESVGTETEIDLRSVVDVWRETSVPASAIEIGDQLMVNGTRTPSSFVARYVYANIGRLDGVIRMFDGRQMLIAFSGTNRGSGETRVELSRDVEIVQLAPGGERPGDKADLTPGRIVGMVIYGLPGMTPRATRIWYKPGPIPSASDSPDRILRRPGLTIAGRSTTPTVVNSRPSAGTFSILIAGTWQYDARIGAVYPVDPDPGSPEHWSPAGGAIAVERLRSTPGGYFIATELAIREQGVERLLYRSPGDGFYWSGWSPDGHYVAL